MSFAVVPVAPGIIVSDLNMACCSFSPCRRLGVYSVVLPDGPPTISTHCSALEGCGSDVELRVFMGLSLMGVILAGSFSLPAIVEAQRKVWLFFRSFWGSCYF